ncbi:hypothetical protein BJ138DRAFT_1155402 [Hygrophoropsis aurantiaca]|uniref:Uncharacterized protein n=1 Tax=Hygrophoropsis aurantiaca TaxID=72124 RepID=A0ACB8A7M6_9AGAM|nr:hypothetical protein BJ138DRAFT_1155402 [Hygrophoropsis aurantiaca]
MLRLLEDPNNVVPPDFTSQGYHKEREILTIGVVALDDARAAQILLNLWWVQNTKDKVRWREQAEGDAQAAKIKPKADKRTDVYKIQRMGPSKELWIFPSPCALIKLSRGGYCEMWYFTNEGLSEEKEASLSGESNPRFRVVHDENLDWEQFNMATSRMQRFFPLCDWQPHHIQMLEDFWDEVVAHPWRYSLDEYERRALFVYQARARKQWHLGPHNQDDLMIKEKHLKDLYYEIRRTLEDKRFAEAMQDLKRIEAEQDIVNDFQATAHKRPRISSSSNPHRQRYRRGN